VVLGVADGRDQLQVAPYVGDGRFEEAERVVDDVRAPVEKLPAAAADQRLPVAA